MKGRMPSASMIVAVIALVIAASGTAVAAAGLVSGDKLIKKHSLSGNRLRNKTITGTQVNLSKLGKVPSAHNADYATTANSAKSATTASAAPIAKLTYVANTVTLPSSPAYVPVTATCPAGTYVTGGGGRIPSAGSSYINDSYPNGKTGWTVDFLNNNGSAESATTTAICAPAAATAP